MCFWKSVLSNFVNNIRIRSLKILDDVFFLFNYQSYLFRAINQWYFSYANYVLFVLCQLPSYLVKDVSLSLELCYALREADCCL